MSLYHVNWLALAIALMPVILTACSPETLPNTSVQGQTARVGVTKRSGIIRINNPSSPSLLDVPYLTALDTLRDQGYTIELKQYARFDLVAPAMAKGELDIASSALQTMWAAISKGAPIRTIASRFRNPYRLIAAEGIMTCADLHEKNLGVGSTSGATNFMMKQNFLEHCPETLPNTIVIAATSNRIPALLNGQLDAAFLEVDDLLELERRARGKFHVLIDFAKEKPDLEISGVFVRDEFAAQNPEVVHDFVRALLNSLRAVQDEAVLEQLIVRQFGMESEPARAAAQTYLKLGVWDVNGGINAARAGFTLDFMKQAKVVPEDATAGQYVDLTFLESALQELSRQ